MKHITNFLEGEIPTLTFLWNLNNIMFKNELTGILSGEENAVYIVYIHYTIQISKIFLSAFLKVATACIIKRSI